AEARGDGPRPQDAGRHRGHRSGGLRRARGVGASGVDCAASRRGRLTAPDVQSSVPDEHLGDLRATARTLRQDFDRALAAAADPAALQSVRDRFLGRRAGALTGLLKTLARLEPEARRDPGRELNALKEELDARPEGAP